MELHAEWYPGKAATNFDKHGVTFEEAATVFGHPLFVTVLDDEHSIGEDRYITIGLSQWGRLLVVAHAERMGLIRIIRARQATRREEKFYAEPE